MQFFTRSTPSGPLVEVSPTSTACREGGAAGVASKATGPDATYVSKIADGAVIGKSVLGPLVSGKQTQMLLANARLGGPRGRSGVKMPAVSINLVETYQVNTTATVDYSTVKVLIPANTTEFASMAALYDECIVDGFTFHWSCVPTTGPASTSAWCIVAFDPIEPAALASVNGGLQHAQHQLWNVGTPAAGSPTGHPGSYMPHGFWSKHFSVPRGSVRSAVATTRFGHEWSDTNDAGDSYGNLKPYLTNIGAGAYTFGGYIVYHMRFRCRS